MQAPLGSRIPTRVFRLLVILVSWNWSNGRQKPKRFPPELLANQSFPQLQVLSLRLFPLSAQRHPPAPSATRSVCSTSANIHLRERGLCFTLHQRTLQDTISNNPVYLHFCLLDVKLHKDHQILHLICLVGACNLHHQKILDCAGTSHEGGGKRKKKYRPCIKLYFKCSVSNYLIWSGQSD